MRWVALFPTLLALGSVGCIGNSPEAPAEAGDRSATSSRYWHQGKAEISRFDLEQVRYGSIHRGHAILIFVKEEFLPTLQVKYEGGAAPETPVTVLKHIATRDFYTGLYPYSLMTSVFSPFQTGDLFPFKITATSQDWCGQTFMQLNQRDEHLAVRYNSYFQSEGDQQFTLPAALLEDGLWNVIRTDPSQLPLGRVAVLPSLHCVQLRIKEFTPHVAEATLTPDPDPPLQADSALVYTLTYQDVPRVFSVTFEAAWPHRILAWEETEDRLPDRSKPGRSPLRTRAVRTHLLLDDYWNHAAPGDSTLRVLLGLP